MEIGLLLAAISAIVGSAAAVSQQSSEHDWQEDQQEKQNQFNVEQQRLQNEYNDPSNQLLRLRRAGMSPAGAASALGTGDQSSPVQSSPMPQSNSIAPFVGEMVSSIGSNTLQYWEKKKLQAEVNNINAQTGWIPKLNSNTIALGDATIKKMNADAGLSEAQSKQIEEMLPLLKGKTQAEIDEVREGIKKIQSEVSKLDEDKKAAAFKNSLREQFGFDPESHDTAALIGVLLSGKSDAIINQLFEVASTLTSPETWLGGFRRFNPFR